MKTTLQRITTKDCLELHGLLFEPDKKTKKALLHIHGWVGNFYENKFIDHIAKEAVSKGFAFLTFNNRGAGIVTDFLKRKKTKVEYVRIGGSLEKFEDCIRDIGATVDFLNKRGYKEIVVEGHSLGCQKVAFYMHKTKDNTIRGIILLAPVDDLGFTKDLLKNRYKKALGIAQKMIRKGKGDNSVPEWMAFYPLLNAKMFLSVADPTSSSGKIFHYSGNLTEIKTINCPTLAVFGSKDEYQEDADGKLKILKKNIKKCDIKLVGNSGHGFVGFEEKLSNIIGQWLKKL